MRLRLGPVGARHLALRPGWWLGGRSWPGRDVRTRGQAPVITGPAEARAVHRVRVLAASPAWLRWFAADRTAGIRTKRATVVVTGWRPPFAGWSGRLGPLPAVVRQVVVQPRRGSRTIRVEVKLREPVELRSILLAALAVTGPVRPLPTVLSGKIGIQDAIPAHLGTQQDVQVFHGEPAELDASQAPDLLVFRGDGQAGELPAGNRVHSVSSLEVADRLANLPIMVDATAINPMRRRGNYGPDGEQLRVELEPAGGWRLVDQLTGAPSCAGSLAVPLVDRDLAALRLVGLVDWSTASVTDDDLGAVARVASLVVQLGMTGAICSWPSVPERVRDLLGTELAAILSEPLPGPGADPLDWEVRSVRQRRAALREHAAGLVIRQSLAPPSAWRGLPTVSALLVTRRPDYLSTALEQISVQTYPQLELILALHGDQIRQVDLEPLLAGCTVPAQVLPLDEKLTFGDALAVATARASGSLISKVDDDDWYGPEHVWDVVLARHYSQAVMAGKPAEFVYLADTDTTVRRKAFTETFSTHVAGGAFVIGRGDLESVGGWRPVRRSVDVTLSARVRAAGGLLYRGHGLGYILNRHGDGHTWDPGLDYFVNAAVEQWPGRPLSPEFGRRTDLG